jgi:multisubunit Na+/H+ antiporter MnhB subunit
MNFWENILATVMACPNFTSVIYRLEKSLSTTWITESNKIYFDIFSRHIIDVHGGATAITVAVGFF